MFVALFSVPYPTRLSMRSSLKVLSLGLLLSSLFVIVGCGGPPQVEITIELVSGGAPAKIPDGDMYSITLNGTKTFSGQTDPTGKLVLKGVTAGSYKVNITHYAKSTGAAPKGPPAMKTMPDDLNVSATTTNFKLDISKLK
jgi:hypothetical protein